MPNILYSTSNTSFSFLSHAFHHVTQVMNDAWSKVATSVSHLSFSGTTESFYQQAGKELNFQYYQRWCSDIKQMERDLLHAMDEKKLSPKVVRKGLLAFIHHLEKNIVSPIYFNHRLNHLKQKMTESSYPVIFQTIIEETQARLKDKLQQQPELAIKYFYDDVVNGVVELSGKKIETAALSENLSYYQTLVPATLYEAVVVDVENFIQMHEKEFAAAFDIYHENTIASSDYAGLIKNVNACFEEAVIAYNTYEIDVTDVATENSSIQQNHATPSSINWRFLGVTALAGTGAYLYRNELNQAFTTTNNHLNIMKQMPWHVANQVDWSTSLFPSWNTLTHAALSYGLYQRLSLTENPVVWSAITILWTTLPQSLAQMIELSSLNGTSGLVMNGVNAGDTAGYALSSGDVNGDNIADVLIGAYFASPGGRNAAGASYVVFGGRGPWPASLELSSLNGTNGFVINGVNAVDASGHALSSGDVNGDNIADVLIGAYVASPGGRTFAGASYVVFGGRGPWPASLELSSLNGTNGFVINGVNAGDVSGYSLSSGDVNGDNITDILIGAYQASPGGRNRAGASYVVFGGRGPWPASLELSSLNGTNGFVMNGVNAGDTAGYAFSSGDVNGDAITDVLIGAYGASPGGRTQAGASYVVFGNRELWPASIELSSLNGTNGLVINGVSAYDFSGSALSSGDVNGDTITDVLVGAWLADPGGRDGAGASYVVFGHGGPWPASLELSSLTGTNGFVMNGVNASDTSGHALSSGDVNGDAITDVLIGAYNADPGGRNRAGASYVVFGGRGPWPASLELSSLNGTNGFVMNGVNASDWSGSALSSGDVNGDNITDVLIGAYNADAGASYVVFGSRTQLSAFTTGQATTASLTTAQSMGTTGAVTTSVQTTTGAIFTTAAAGAVTTSVQTTTGAILTTAAAGNSSSQPPSNLPLIVGITIGSLVFVICGGSVAYLCLRKRLRRPPIDRLSTELGDFQSESSTHDVTEVQTPLSPKREENKYTVIGKRYELINKIKRSDAEILFEQTGIKVDFPENQNKVEVVLGKGQFGKLRVARVKQTGEFVGVKKIKGKTQIEASQNEAALQEVLKGKSNIMPLLDAVETKGSDDQPVLYQFMPLAGFGNGDKFKEQFAQMDDELMKNQLLIHIARSLLTGLSHMHAAGIYHLDMKPSNFVIDNKGNVSIIDFGCAVKADNEQGKIGLSNGDSRYFSPDRLAQCRYARGIIEGGVTEVADSFSGAVADAWALGMTLYEIATNQYPFSRTSFTDKLIGADTQYFETQLQFISELNNPKPDSYMALIKGLLDPNPKTRLTPQKALSLLILLIFQNSYYAFPSPDAQKAAFDHLRQPFPASSNDALQKSPDAHLKREENENYSKTYFDRYVYSKTSIEGKYYQSPSPVTLFKPVKPETPVITTHTQVESGYDIQANTRVNPTLTRSNSSD